MRMHTLTRHIVAMAFLSTALGVALQGNLSPREQLRQYVADLQRSPYDDALREKIIKLALTLDPKPAVPEEAERRMVRGEAAFERAQNVQDYNNAIPEFSAALSLAPWLANGYFNLGTAQEKAGKPQDAIRSFRFYLLAAPEAPDAAAVKRRIYKLEYATEEEARKNSQVAQAQATAEAAARAKRESFEGKWFRVDWGPEHLYMTVSRTTAGWSVTKNLEGPVTGTQPSRVWVEGNTLYWLEVWYWNNPPDRYRFDCKLSLDGSELSCTMRDYGDFTRPRGTLTLSRR